MQLTDTIIHDSYLQLGLDDKYFPIYEEEVKRCYAELQDGCPDDEDTSDDDSNVMGSIQLSNQYIECYAGEIEKGHGEKWASVFTRNFVIGEKDDIVVYEALKAVEDKAEKEKELDIHAKSLNEDPIFQQRYKTLVKELDGNSEEMAKEYSLAYHNCIKKGKSDVYAHAYASVAPEYYEHFCKIYARAYELAISHGQNEFDAMNLGHFCMRASDQGVFIMQSEFARRFKEDWQREFYLHLMCEESEEIDKRNLSDSEIEELRKGFGK